MNLRGTRWVLNTGSAEMGTHTSQVLTLLRYGGGHALDAARGRDAARALDHRRQVRVLLHRRVGAAARRRRRKRN